MSAHYHLISLTHKRMLTLESMGGICAPHAGSTYPISKLISYTDLSGRQFRAPAYRPDWRARAIETFGDRGESGDAPLHERVLLWVAEYDDGQLFWLHSDCLGRDEIEVAEWGWPATYNIPGDHHRIEGSPWLRDTDDFLSSDDDDDPLDKEEDAERRGWTRDELAVEDIEYVWRKGRGFVLKDVKYSLVDGKFVATYPEGEEDDV